MSREGWKKVKIESSPIDIIDGDRGSNYPKQDEFHDTEHCLFLKGLLPSEWVKLYTEYN